MTEVFVENFAKVQFTNSLFFASSKFKRAPSSYLGRMATESLMIDENNKLSGSVKTLADQTLSISTVSDKQHIHKTVHLIWVMGQ